MKLHGFGSGDPAMDGCRRQGVSLAPGASRREFLKALAATGAGVMLPASGLLAQTARPASRANSRRIDVHHHMQPPEYLRLRRQQTTNRNWTPAKSVEDMDKNGTATAIASVTTPGVWFGDVQEGRSLARVVNEYGAQMVRDYPGRFGFFAVLPMPDPEGSLREIEYAFDVLKADGVGLFTSYQDKWLGDPVFAPAFAELNRRRAVVFVHVTVPTCCQNLFPGHSGFRAEVDYDTTRTVESLLVNGTLAKCPNIRFILVHSGGTLPVLSGRINDRFPKDRPDLAPDGVLGELKKFYYEVAHATFAMPLAALTKFVPISQILFGTDYPVEPFETTTKPLAEFGFSARDLQAIDRGNAERLFPRLKA